jgi:cytochrome c oxidase subunit 2
VTNLIPSMLMQSGADAALTPSDAVTPKTFWLPQGASTIAPESDWIFNYINYINYFFFFLVIGIMLYFVVKYRQKGREVYARGPAHNTVLELTWTIIPTIIVVVIFFMGFKGFVSMKTVPQNAYQIDVTASQWAWSFKYPNGATSDDLYVPAGKPVKLVMRSQDVLHSLFIPDFRVKQDVVPGRYTTLWFQADAPNADGDFHMLFCTEFCGKDHSRMNRHVYVLNDMDFDAWVVEQGRWLDAIPEEELYSKAGPKLFGRCASCHTLDGKPSTGPSWGNYDGSGDIWARTSSPDSTHKVDGKSISELIGQGKEFETPEGYLRQSILIPGKHLVDGFGNAMPTFQGQLSDKAIDALIGMMKHLDEFDAKGKWIGKPEGK